MKKILFLLGIVSTLLSCENDNFQSNNSIDSNAKINQILELESQNEQKLAYSLLNANEKATIWKKHLDLMISYSDYNNEQVEFINNLQKSLTTTFFSEKSESKDKFNKNMIFEGLKIFSKQELYNLIASLSLNSRLQGGGPPPISTCGCSTSSDWCLSGDCNGTAYCLRDSDNCGTFWQSTCNGDCA